MYLDSRGYAYRTIRQNGRVKRCYVGAGIIAQLEVEMEAHRRAELAEIRLRQSEREARLKRLNELVSQMCEISEEYRQACIKAAGYHQHDRGQWRKARKSTMSALAVQNAPAAPLANVEAEVLLKKAQAGDMESARELYRRIPADQLPAILASAAPTTERAENAMIEALSGDVMVRAATEKRLELMKAELAGPCPSPLERHLVDRVAICWLQVVYYEHLMALSCKASQAVQEHMGKIHGKRLESAHRRHLQAIKALAQVRQMKLPNVQINLGQNQVNVNAP